MRARSSASRHGRRAGWRAPTRISRRSRVMPTRSRSSAPISTAAADFAQRDADLARIVPLMTRILPGRLITTIAQATEFNALSQELDQALLARLPRADGTLHRRRILRRLPVASRPRRRANARSASSAKSAPVSTHYVRRPFIRVGAHDDAAAGAHRGSRGAAGFSGAGSQGVPEDARRRRSSWPPSIGASASSWQPFSKATTRPFRSRRCHADVKRGRVQPERPGH